MAAFPSHDELVRELAELIAIPSVSADATHVADLARAAEWVAERIRAAGGEAAVETVNGRAFLTGEIRASGGGDAPTVLGYAHLDVQPPDPLELWTSDPWTLVERDGLLFARGVADDKGHAYLLVKAAATLAAAGELPVNVRFAFDAEEEVGGHTVVDWVTADARGADVALVLDGGYVTEELPSFCTALRGLCYFHLKVRTGERDLHSGIFGGGALNALHALVQILGAVLAGPDGRVPEPLREGIVPPTDAELAGWSSLRTGAEELAGAGARPMDATAERDFWLRTTSEPTVEVNGIEGGSARLQKTVLPVEALANISVRLAPGQRASVIGPVMARLLREACPPGAELELEQWASSEPGWVDSAAPAIQLTRAAFADALGAEPVLARTGGAIPVVASLCAKGIPVVVSGFTRPSARMHSPDENIPAAALDDGLRATVEALRRLGSLERR
ncbi:MAG: M20/M25/M40 family metallo-hydrolase [Thermoleophilia bacterium]|nr:M20/M25/M40 family metallo-hydrolase [Thermoleophilia bacterium]